MSASLPRCQPPSSPSRVPASLGMHDGDYDDAQTEAKNDSMLVKLLSLNGPLRNLLDSEQKRLFKCMSEPNLDQASLVVMVVDELQKDLTDVVDGGCDIKWHSPGKPTPAASIQITLRVSLGPEDALDNPARGKITPKAAAIGSCRLDCLPRDARRMQPRVDASTQGDPMPASLRNRLDSLLFPEHSTLRNVRDFLVESARGARTCAEVARDIARTVVAPALSMDMSTIRQTTEQWAKPLYGRLFECYARLDDVCSKLLPSLVSALQAYHTANIVLADAGMGSLIYVCEKQHDLLNKLQLEVADLRAKLAMRAQISEAAELSKEKVNDLQKLVRQQEKLYKELIREVEELKVENERQVKRVSLLTGDDLKDLHKHCVSRVVARESVRSRMTLEGSVDELPLANARLRPNNIRVSAFRGSCGFMTTQQQRSDAVMVTTTSVSSQTESKTICFPWSDDRPAVLDEGQYASAVQSLKEGFRMLNTYGSSSKPQGYASVALEKQRHVATDKIEKSLTLSNKVWMQNALLKIENSEQFSEISRLKMDRLTCRKALKNGWREWSAGWGIDSDDISRCWKDILSLIETEGLHQKLNVLQDRLTESEVNFARRRSTEEAVGQRLENMHQGSSGGIGFWDRVLTACLGFEGNRKNSRFHVMPLQRLVTEVHTIWNNAIESPSGYRIPRHEVQAYYLRLHGSMTSVEECSTLFAGNCRHAKHLTHSVVLLFSYLAGFRSDWTESHFDSILTPSDGYYTFPNPSTLLVDVSQNLKPNIWLLLTRVRKQLLNRPSTPGKATTLLDPKHKLQSVLEIVFSCIRDEGTYSRECYFNFLRALLEFADFHHPEGLRELLFFSHNINALLHTKDSTRGDELEGATAADNDLAVRSDDLEGATAVLWDTIQNSPVLSYGCVAAGVISKKLIPQLEKAFRVLEEKEDDLIFAALLKAGRDDESMRVKETTVLWCLLIAASVERQKELEILSDLYLAFDVNHDEMMDFHEFYVFVREVAPSVTRAEAEESFIRGVNIEENNGEMSRKAFMSLILNDHLTIANMATLESLAERKRAEIIANWNTDSLL